MKKFKYLWLLCFVIAFMVMITVGASAAAIPGDVNGDSEVNIRDAASVLLYANGKPVECVNDVVDADGDGVIDQNDAQTLLESITGHEDVVLNTGDACEHELSFVEGYVGTCPESGLVEHWVCTKCSKIFKDKDAVVLSNTAGVTLEPKHIPGEWTVETPAGKTENGLKVIRCQSCQTLLDSEVIPYTGSIGLEYTLNTDGNSYSVSGIGTCTDTEVAIPSTYEGLPVTVIGEEAFSGCSQLVSVIMPDSIILVRSLAFDYCTNLMNVDFSDSITALGIQAFGNCASLTYIDLPKNLKHFNSHVFIDCTNLKSITIPENVEYIDEWAVFSYCPSIESIVVDENNKYYHSQNNCLIDTKTKSLIYGCKNSVIPNDGSVTSLADFAFAGCNGLKSITIPASVTSIGTLAFGYCTGLETIVVEEGNPVFSSSGNCLILTATKEIILGCKKSIIPTDESVTKIGSSAFQCCTGIASITIPDNIISIGSYAFSECSSLTNIVIPNSVTSIGAGAFEKCSSLTSITIPNSVKSIGNDAFFYCKNLSSFTFDGTAEEWEKVEKGKNWNDGCPFTEVFFTKVSASQGLEFTLNEDGKSYSVSGIGTCTDTEIAIPETYEGLPVTRIGDNAFYKCSIIGITIPDSVTSIGSGAFNNCSELTNIIIPDSVISIGNSAFAGCTSLTSINIPNSITSIGSGIFKRCSSLTSIILPNSITSIGNGAFENCTSLTSVNIPNSVINLGDRAFSTCSSLISIIVPNSVTSIGKYVFRDCKNLSTFIFDGTAEEWEKVAKGENWNSGCPFTEVKFTSSSAPEEPEINGSVGLEYTLNSDGQSYTVSGIGTCTDTEIVIPEIYEGLPVTRIGDEAFYNCSIIGITIPDSVTSIGDEAFSYCPELKSLHITNKVTYIGSHAFVACSEMESIVVEQGNTFYHSDNNCLIETASKKLIVGCQNSVIPTDGSVTSIGDLAFSWSNLSSINIPDCITSIGKEAFSFNYFDSINIPDSVTSIGDYAFVGCYFLTNVDMPNGITNIGEMMFYGCANLTSITIPNSVTSIGYEAFYECTSLSTFIFDGTAEEWEKVEKDLDWNYGCPFTEVIFTKESEGSHKHNLIHVPAKAPTCYENGNIEYWYCSECDWVELEGGIATNKKAVSLPASHNLKIVMTQNASCTQPGIVIQECSSCKSYVYEKTEMLPHTESEWIIALEPTETKDGRRYKACEVCGQITANEVILRPGAAEHEHTIVIIPATEATCLLVGWTEGQKCEICLEILVPQAEIPRKEHQNVLVTEIPATCTVPGYIYYSCTYCRTNTSKEIPILDHRFNSTEVPPTKNKDGYIKRICIVCGLTETEILPATGSLGLAYSLNSDGKSYSVTGIGTCTDTEIVIPEIYEGFPVTGIGSTAFRLCTQLTNITIPNSVTNIDAFAFSYCIGLTDITISSRITYIGNSAFEGCSELKTITLSGSISIIGAFAFAFSENLSNFTYDGTAEEWEKVEKGENWNLNCPFTEVIFTKESEESHKHNLIHVSAKASTCFENGNIEHWYCSTCDWMETVGGIATNRLAVIIPASHTLAHVAAKEATCFETGNVEYWCCIVCGYAWLDEALTLVTNLKAVQLVAAHELVRVPAKVPTCFEDGNTEHWYCTKCDWMELEGGIATNRLAVIIPASHTIAHVEAVAPTVSTNGNVEYWYCTVCGYAWLDEAMTLVTNLKAVILPATGSSSGLAFTLNEDGQSYSVSGIGTCTDTDIVIPSTHEGLPVTRIGDQAFYYYRSLTSITIPNSVTSIGIYAFSFCTSLTSISIPNSVTYIQYSAFPGCSGLESIVVESGNTVYHSVNNCLIETESKTLIVGCKNSIIPTDGSVTSIGDSAFNGCSSLTSITIPNSVTSIGDSAFRGCSSLTSITIPNSVTSIREWAFYGCSNLATISISNGCTSIGYYSFAWCSSLTNIIIPDSVTSIGNYSFYCCQTLSVFTFDGTFQKWEKVKKEGMDWNYGCPFTEVVFTKVGASEDLEFILNEDGQSYSVTGIGTCTDTKIVIPATYEGLPVTRIGDEAFIYCFSLASISIPDSVMSIGNSAFFCCYELKSITIPNSVKSIGHAMFADCSGLESVVVEEGNTVYHSYNNCIIETASKKLIAGCKNSVIPTDGSVTSIEDYAFYSLDIINITIPDSVTSIGNFAFSGCPRLISINIPNSVISIGEYAFSGGNSLTSFTIPDSVTTIGDCAFYGCSSLTSIIIPDSVTSIGDGLFSFCSSLTSVTIPNSVTSIGDSAFFYCSSLTSITIPNSVTSIGGEAFRYCSSLASINIPNSVTSIKYGVFDSCSSLTNITIPNSIISIGDVAFCYCQNLSSFTFVGTVEEWEKVAKGNIWKYSCSFSTIHCTDGDVSVN